MMMFGATSIRKHMFSEITVAFTFSNLQNASRKDSS